jgi:hypothetical protein
MWYMHDGAPGHFGRAVRDVFNNTCRYGWTGKEDHCMASKLVCFESSGLLPVGTPKTFLYAAPVDNEETLLNRIADVCQIVCNFLGFLGRMR